MVGPHVARWLPVLGLWLTACHPPVEVTFTPTLPTGGCGAPEYTWADMSRMGEVLFWERDAENSLEASMIEFLLDEAGADVFTPVPYDVRLYRVRYLTQDRGQLVEASQLVAFPDLDTPTEVPSVLWLHHTMGFSDSCAPSAQGITGAAAVLILASQGFAVAAPDYLGMTGVGDPSGELHPYVIAEPTAVASLDALRAMWRFAANEGDAANMANPTTEVAFWGASEGGFAALWADRYAPGYLPEAQVVGTVAAIPPTDVLGLAQAAVSYVGPPTEALAAILATGNPWYGNLAPLDTVFASGLASQVSEVLATECDGGDLFDDVVTVADAYTPEFVSAVQDQDWAAAAPWSCYLQQSTLHTSEVPLTSATPTLFILADADELVLTSVERADVPRLCDAGYALQYLECAGTDHVGAAAESLPYQYQWIWDRFDGVEIAAEDTCAITPAVDCGQL